MIDPPRWNAEDLERDAKVSIEAFRKEQLEELPDEYHEAFDDYQINIEELFETTIDLTDCAGTANTFAVKPKLLQAFRYISGPPISVDDLKTLAEIASINSNRLKNEPDSVKRIVDVIQTALDRRRFPWINEQREPTEIEKSSAIVATAALMATQRLGTNRRSRDKKLQEGKVEATLIESGLTLAEKRKVNTHADAPRPGAFCGESKLGKRKADFIIRLWDNRIMAIECKVSASATNSVKRLNNDAAAKAEAWRRDFGETQVIPVAVLGGVYKLHNLQDAEHRGLTLFWAHDLKALTDWIEKTQNA